MSIKAGAILHDVNGYVVDRIQSAGPGNLNIPEEKIYELGNWETVATVRDIPDLSFDLESFDMSCEFEAILMNEDPTNLSAGQEFDFKNHVPIDVVSPFKSRRNAFDIVKGLAVPYLTLERATYRFGLRQNATQQFTLRGDSIYYTPGQPRYETHALNASDAYEYGYSGAQDAILYVEGNENIYALCVVAVADNGTYRRLFAPEDYTSDTDSFTLTAIGHDRAIALSDDGATASEVTLRVVYSTETTGDYLQTVHPTDSVKPAAVRPKDINLYIGSTGPTPNWVRFNSVQSAEVTWSVTLENDEEFGNKHYVAQDYDTPDVTGTIGVKPFDPTDLWSKLSDITGVDEAQVIGPELTIPVQLLVVVDNPNTGDPIKTLLVDDARFQVPGMQGRVQTKLETSFSFTSDGGNLIVYNGDSGLLV